MMIWNPSDVSVLPVTLEIFAKIVGSLIFISLLLRRDLCRPIQNGTTGGGGGVNPISCPYFVKQNIQKLRTIFFACQIFETFPP